MKITVIGCGRWGSFIAYYLDSIKHNVTLYGRSTSKNMHGFIANRKNDLLTLPKSVALSTDLSCTDDAQVIVISINSQGLPMLMEELRSRKLKNKIFVLCMKGLDINTGKRLSEIAKSHTDISNDIAVWLGPGHVQEFCRGIPNCMVIDGENEATKHLLINEFASNLIRFYYGRDLIGNEIGAAAKNVIGIAAGMLDGLGLTSLKGALMSRGTAEISRLISKQGGNLLSAYGLCHLGDYEATVFSEFSHNRKFGESLVRGEKYDKLAEGFYTVKALIALADKYEVDLPICRAVYNVLYKNGDPSHELNALFCRDLKGEY